MTHEEKQQLHRAACNGERVFKREEMCLTFGQYR
jgi:hypothetical protein